MSTSALLFDVRHLHRRWGSFLFLGILLIVLGIIALVFTSAATLASVLILGWLMIVSGIVEAVHAFYARGWGGVLLHVAGAALGILVGLIVVTDPLAGALAFTLLFAAFCTVLGLFRLIGAIWLRYPSWGWAFSDGAITLVLGVLLWAAMPRAGLWFLGFTLGIALILRGGSDMAFALTVRSVDHPIALRPAA